MSLLIEFSVEFPIPRHFFHSFSISNRLACSCVLEARENVEKKNNLVRQFRHGSRKPKTDRLILNKDQFECFAAIRKNMFITLIMPACVLRFCLLDSKGMKTRFFQSLFFSSSLPIDLSLLLNDYISFLFHFN